MKEMVNLAHVPTDALMCELVQRTIANDKAAIPLSLLQLVCLMASVRGTIQCLAFAEELRDAADALENSTWRVHV
jgi:hypothetical protein